MSEVVTRRKTLLRVALHAALVVACLGATWLLYRHHLDQGELGERSDNSEWRDEARDRDTWSEVLDYHYRSGRHGPSAYYNPVQLTVWRLLVSTFDYGTEQRPYYLLCILIHALNVVVAFLIARKLLGAPLPAFLSALSFAVFFPNFLTIGWVAATVTTGLSGLFLWLAIYLFILSFEGRRGLLLALSTVSYALALFTKEFTVFAIPIMAAYYVIVRRERTLRPRKTDLLLLPACVVTVPMALIVSARLEGSAIVNDWGGFNFGVHMAYRFLDLAAYLVAAEVQSPTVTMVLAAAVLALVAAVAFFGRKEKPLAFVATWVAIALFVYSYSNFREVQELPRYLYQPSLPWFILVYYGVSRARGWRAWALAAPLAAFTIGYNVYLVLGRQGL